MSLRYDFSIYPRNVHVNKRLPDSTMKSHSAIRNSFKFGHQSALNPWTVCLLYRSLHYRTGRNLLYRYRPEPLPRPNLPCALVQGSTTSLRLGSALEQMSQICSLFSWLSLLWFLFKEWSIPRQVWELEPVSTGRLGEERVWRQDFSSCDWEWGQYMCMAYV